MTMLGYNFNNMSTYIFFIHLSNNIIENREIRKYLKTIYNNHKKDLLLKRRQQVNHLTKMKHNYGMSRIHDDF